MAKWKKDLDTQTHVNRYNIKVNTPIMTDAIYSNYYKFSVRYKNTFDIRKRSEPNEFVYFSKHLIECATVFGDPFLEDMNSYHNISYGNIIFYYLSNKYIRSISFIDSFEIILSYY